MTAELTLGWGFLVFLLIGAIGVFLQRGAPYFLPERVLRWPVLTTLNRLLPGALILLFFLVSWLTQDRKSTRLNSSHSQQSRMPSSA